MEEQQIGWIAAIIIGGIAGWLAEQFIARSTILVSRTGKSIDPSLLLFVH